ncbi:hypothetical protein V1512DRAFT_231065 [Lipomyces arxii]|uniref:uncharacterized protein n=1 Tax=Lipomyces arxii TaxID=56418 RepID=UPI0034CF7D4B
MTEFSKDYTKNVRILDLTNLHDAFADVESRYTENLIAGKPTGPRYNNLRSFLFDRETPFPACCPNAEELRVAEDIIDGQTSMITCLRYLHKLVTLDVKNATIGLGSFSGITARLNCPALTELKIQCTGTLDQENVHIANFIKSLDPHTLTKVSISGITQLSSIKKLMEGLNMHSESLRSLKLFGTTKRILKLLPSVTFMPFLQELELVTSSRIPLSAKDNDGFVNWLFFLPSLTSLVLTGHDADYLVHRALARPFNTIQKVAITLTRREDVPLFRYDLFFRGLASCQELVSCSLVDGHNHWSAGALIRCTSALKHLTTLKQLDLGIHGISEPDVIALLHALPALESARFCTQITDRTLRRLCRHNTTLRKFTCYGYLSSVSAATMIALLELRDQDDSAPLTVTLDHSSKLAATPVSDLLHSVHTVTDGVVSDTYTLDGGSAIELRDPTHAVHKSDDDDDEKGGDYHHHHEHQKYVDYHHVDYPDDPDAVHDGTLVDDNESDVSDGEDFDGLI